MPLDKIISGGQTGADMGGLLAAKFLGIPTGGHCPAGWLTEKGPNPKLQEYGLVCTKSKKYPIRTILNIRNSEATIGFGNQTSSGTKMTKLGCEEIQKPYFAVPDPWSRLLVPEFLLFLEKNNIKILNVAGNRESKKPGLQKTTKEWLIYALQV